MDLNREPATKADLGALEQRIEGRMDALEKRMDGRMEGRMDTLDQRLTDRFTEAIRDTETKLLQAFYFFVETNNKRLA